MKSEPIFFNENISFSNLSLNNNLQNSINLSSNKNFNAQ